MFLRETSSYTGTGLFPAIYVRSRYWGMERSRGVELALLLLEEVEAAKPMTATGNYWPADETFL